MGISVNTNLLSMVAQRNLDNNLTKLEDSMEKLATGRTINHASDDAAMLAITTQMASDVQQMEVTITGLNSVMSMMQIADGAASEVTDILSRMTRLAAQSSNPTLSDTSRGYYVAEFTKLSGLVDQISTTTNFNGTTLLDGTFNKYVKVGIGTSDADQVNATLGSMSAKTLGVNARSITIANGTDTIKDLGTVVKSQTTTISTTADTVITVDGGVITFDADNNTVTLTDANITLTNLTDAHGDDDHGTGNITITDTTISFIGTVSDGVLTVTGGSKSIKLAGGTATVTNAANGFTADTATLSGTATEVTLQTTDPTAATITTSGVDISTELNAQAALITLSSSLTMVNSERAVVGAYQQEFYFNMQNLQVSYDNTCSALSHDIDTDVAAEFSKMTSKQVAVQISISMLQQANSITRYALDIVKG